MRLIVPLAILVATFILPVNAAQPPGPDEEIDIGEVTVTATRSRQLVRDQAVRVEVVPQEELEESQTAVPGNLTNLLNELAGVSMEAASAGFGSTSLRLRGMPGRHAQVLLDGLSPSGAIPDSLSLLQVPPIDLQRVEVIKGNASALYGGSALAGVLNLVSRPPDADSQLLFSQSSLGGADGDVFLASGADAHNGLTFTGSAHYQSPRDPDQDGWSELTGYKRLTLRPRWYVGSGDQDTLVTLGLIAEDRTGGSKPFGLELDTRHFDAGLVTNLRRDADRSIGLKVNAAHTSHDRTFGATPIEDTATSLAAEATYQASAGAHQWTIGAALQYDELSVSDVPGVGFEYTVPALFAQDEFSPAKWLSISGSARIDAHSDFGTFLSPRLSALFRLNPDVSLRVSAGGGFAPPTPLLDETEDIGFGSLEPMRGLRAEQASSASLDLKWLMKPCEINASAFASDIRHALDVEATAQAGRIVIVNDRKPFRVRGGEFLAACVIGETHLLASTTYLDASEEDRLPKLSAELAAIFELEGRGRAGFEISYTGTQQVHDDPFLTRTSSFVEINALAEVKLARFSVFMNAFNLTDVRQQDYEPVLRPPDSPGLGGAPFTSAWAPLIGRYFSAGVRVSL